MRLVLAIASGLLLVAVTFGLAVSIWLTLDTRDEVRAIRSDVSDVQFAVEGVEGSLGQGGSDYLPPESLGERIDDVMSRIEDLSLMLDEICFELNASC